VVRSGLGRAGFVESTCAFSGGFVNSPPPGSAGAAVDEMESAGPQSSTVRRAIDPSLTSPVLLIASAPLVGDPLSVYRPESVDPTHSADSPESTKAASDRFEPDWDDLTLTAQLLTDTTGCGVTDTLMACARAKRQALEEAVAALEAWDSAKHPRGGFPQNSGWWSTTGGAVTSVSPETTRAAATAKIFTVGAPAATPKAPPRSIPSSRTAANPATTVKPAQQLPRPQIPLQPRKPAPPVKLLPRSTFPAAKPPASSIGTRVLGAIARALGIAGQIGMAPGALGQQGGQSEEGFLQTSGYYLKKLVDAGKISKVEANRLLLELQRIYRASTPTFRGTRSEQMNQHLALLQRSLVSLMTKSALSQVTGRVARGEEERIAAVVDAALGKPDHRTFDLDEMVKKARHEIAAQAAKSARVPQDEKTANTNSPQGTGVSSTAAPAGQGGRQNGGSGKGGAPVAQGGEGDDGGGKYRCGRHRETSKPSGDGLYSHYMPADSSTDLPTSDGPAIQMDKVDHHQTASYGNVARSDLYRAKQAKLVKQGRFGEAIQMDIDDIRYKFGAKYDQAIREMIKSLDKWMTNGLKEPH
jgi:hypothetical protein